MKLLRQPDAVDHYKRLRAAARGLSSKIHDATCSLDFDTIKAAKKLTIPVRERTLIFDNESDTAALMDFYLHEFRSGGRRPVDCCDPDAMTLSADQRDLLEAHRRAGTSLFEIAGSDARKAQVHLRNLLSPEEPDVMLSDLALSASGDIAGQVLLFVRIVACQGIAMTSGCFFAFSTKHQARLIDGYAQRMRSVRPGEISERRFVFFFQRHREFGEPQEFAPPV
jgi:hypothetical protein